MISPQNSALCTNALNKVRVLCCGELSLDSFVCGKVSRISPEAPIPVLRIEREVYEPGLLGRTAEAVAALGGTPAVIAVAGDDETAAEARRLATDSFPDAVVITEPGRSGAVSRRYVAGGQQLLRAEHTMFTPVAPETRAAFAAAMERALPECSAVLLIGSAGEGCVIRAGIPVVAMPAPGGALIRSGSGQPVRIDVAHDPARMLAAVACALASGSDVAQALRECEPRPRRSAGKVMSREDAAGQVQEWRRSGLRVGFTNGCFDLLHPGHVSLLEQAKAKCDRLVLGLNTDASVQRLKGPTRPIQDEQSRATVLAALSSVDLVTLFDEETPLELILALRPDVLVKGADYQPHEVVGAPEVQSWGGELVLVELLPGRSTTNTVQRIASAQRSS